MIRQYFLRVDDKLLFSQTIKIRVKAVYDELKWPILNNNHKLNSTDSPFYWDFSQLCAVFLFRVDWKLYLLADRFPAAQWVEQFNAKAVSARNASLGNLSFFLFWLLFQLNNFFCLFVFAFFSLLVLLINKCLGSFFSGLLLNEAMLFPS